MFSSFLDFCVTVNPQHQLTITVGLLLEFLYRPFSDFFIGVDNILTGTLPKPP